MITNSSVLGQPVAGRVAGGPSQHLQQASGTIGKGSENKDMILYRPVGLQELVLIYKSGMKVQASASAPTTDLLSGSSTVICQPEAVIRKKNTP